MPALWFTLVVFMLTMYAILDGLDLGAGIHLVLARQENERRSILAAIGPFWDGNEVWLMLAGGSIYCAFPAVYFSYGFYPLAIVVLWLLILRGISTEFRARTESALWRRLLDTSFGISGLLLTVGLGAAVGCVIRGVPPTSESRLTAGLLVLCGICGVAVLTLQSAAWIALKSDGELQTRCRSLASRMWWAVLFCYAGVTAVSFTLQPHLLNILQTYSWISVFAVVTLAGLIGARLSMSVGFDLGTFASVCCVIAGLISSAAAGQFPYLLNQGPQSLTIYNAGLDHLPTAASAIWWAPAFLLAIGYNVKSRVLRHKLQVTNGTVGVQPRPMMTAGD